MLLTVRGEAVKSTTLWDSGTCSDFRNTAATGGETDTSGTSRTCGDDSVQKHGPPYNAKRRTNQHNSCSCASAASPSTLSRSAEGDDFKRRTISRYVNDMMRWRLDACCACKLSLHLLFHARRTSTRRRRPTLPYEHAYLWCCLYQTNTPDEDTDANVV